MNQIIFYVAVGIAVVALAPTNVRTCNVAHRRQASILPPAEILDFIQRTRENFPADVQALLDDIATGVYHEQIKHLGLGLLSAAQQGSDHLEQYINQVVGSYKGHLLEAPITQFSTSPEFGQLLHRLALQA